MPIIACGVNHKTAAIELRERVTFPSDKISLYLQDLMTDENIKEAALLSTCNRSEIYCQADEFVDLQSWFCRQHQIDENLIRSAWYCFHDLDAVAHIMKVSCGLDSMVLGEPEILGQMKDAFSESCAAGGIGPQFNRLFQQVFTVAKEVRTHTSIGACPVSIASATFRLIKTLYSNSLDQAKFLLIGAGETIQLLLRYLQTHQIKNITIANRHLDRAASLGYPSVSLNQLPHELQQADIVISATQSPHPLVNKEMLQSRSTPIMMVDIAVPRDIDPAVQENPFVILRSLDDLKEIIQQNLRGREHAAEKAFEMIQHKSEELMGSLHSFDHVAVTIRAFRKQIEDLCQGELVKAEHQLKLGLDPATVLHMFAHGLTNKLLHHPSVQLRQAGFEGRFDLLQMARQLFILPEYS